MSEHVVDNQTRLARIRDAAKAAELAKAEWEKANEAEIKAHKERVAKGDRHRAAMLTLQQEMFEGWREGIKPDEIREAGGITSKTWFFRMLKKFQQ